MRNPPKKTPGTGKARPGRENPAVETGWRETRVMAVMSGGLIRCLVNRTCQPIKSQRYICRIGNLTVFPARNHRLRNPKLFGDSHLRVTAASKQQEVFLC